MAKSYGGIRGWGGDVAATKVLSVIADLKSKGYSRMKPFSIGLIEYRMKKYAEKHNMDLPDEIYMKPLGRHSIAHAMRESKTIAGKSVDPIDLANFARNRVGMDLYFDHKTKNFTYSDGRNKYILCPNEVIKTSGGDVKKVGFLTAQKLSATETFKGSRFDKITH